MLTKHVTETGADVTSFRVLIEVSLALVRTLWNSDFNQPRRSTFEEANSKSHSPVCTKLPGQACTDSRYVRTESVRRIQFFYAVGYERIRTAEHSFPSFIVEFPRASVSMIFNRATSTRDSQGCVEIEARKYQIHCSCEFVIVYFYFIFY